MDERMDVGKIDYYARIDILRKDYLMEESFPGISYQEKFDRMGRMDTFQFVQDFSEVLIKRMLVEN